MANQVHGPEGMIFANKYRIVKLIGSGGMANVYLGIDMNTGVNVAIKILKPEFSSDEEFIRRFDAEAKSVASLNHANIVKVYGVGHEGNFRYIVPAYIEGITVKDLINQNGHLDWRNAVPIVIQIGLALDYAHQNGIVHRDIKPQNILISRDRVAKITDFGIARAASTTTITMTGVQMGSVHYFSPEQARGGNVGPQSDVYSLGVSLFEMVTGRLPFDGDSNVAIAVKHLQETPPVPSSLMQGIPKGLDSIIAKCMQKSPERRYQTMRQLVTELDSLLVDPNGVYGVITNVPEKTTSTDTNISFRQDPEYEKITEIEKSAESRRISRFRDNILLALIIVVIVGVLVGIGILVVRAVGNATQIEENTDYTVENYVGLTADEVIKKLDNAWFVFDTLGLALFTIAGMQKTLDMGHSFWVAIIMGTITGSAGGVIRDVLLNSVPVIFQKEIYAMASIVGGVLYWLMIYLGVNVTISATVSFFVIVAIRFLAVRYHLSLPKLKEL